MQAIYHRKNMKAPWVLQWDQADTNISARAELENFAKVHKTGKLVLLHSAQPFPTSVWDMRTLDCRTLSSAKSCKYYLTDYRIIKRNGKRFWSKLDPRQLTLKMI